MFRLKRSLKMIASVAVVLCFLIVSERAGATHAAGADLTYTCLGGNVYRIEASFYRDCSGSNEPTSVTLRYSSASCGYSFSAIAPKAPAPNGLEITMPCAAQPSSCNGGFSTGLRKWVYRTTVTLPAACSDWVFSYKVCCRNCSITTIQSPCATGSEIYVESRLNNILAPGNSSPYFTNDPIAIMPIGQLFNYHQSVTDPDGDSLHYELITPMTSATSGVTFIPPASSQAPMASSTPFSIDQRTGDIMFTPSMMQIGILAVKVSEYRNGVCIGSTIRDMQVYTYNSSNTVPSVNVIPGNGPPEILACAGQQTCVTLNTFDPDSAQLLHAEVSCSIPGATVTVTPGPRPQILFCFTPDSNQIRSTPWFFTVTVRDDACPVNGIKIISVPVYVQGLSMSASVVSNTCLGSNSGSAQVVTLAGAPASIVWSTVPPQISATATGLYPGNYHVSVTDSAGCSFTDSVTIGAWPAVTATSSIDPILCAGNCSGAAIVNVTGGTAPFFYSWNNGSSSSAQANLCPGNYSYVVTDANGCTAVDSLVLLPQSGIQVTGTVNVPPCGSSSGSSINVTVAGAVGAVNYQWSTGAVTKDISGLQSGMYTLTVSDSLGCQSTNTFTVGVTPDTLVVSAGFQNISCHGANSGSASIYVNGGTPPYQYMWQNGNSMPSLSGLYAGTYLYTVTDQNGCTKTGEVIISEPASSVSGNISTNQIISCFGDSNGVLQAFAMGGTPGYSYLWSNGSVASSITGITAGNYAVTITDSSGCSVMLNAYLEQPLSPLFNISAITHSECLAGKKGSVSLSPSGGTPTYIYEWSNGSVSKDIVNLESGTYTVLITDMSGCTLSQTYTVEEHSELKLLSEGQINICSGQMAHIFTDSLPEGYQLQWYYSGNLLPGALGPELQTPAAGFYYVAATGNCGNFLSDTTQVIVRSVENASVSTNRIICPPENTKLHASGGVSYLWTPTTGLDNSMVPDPVAGPDVTTQYSVTVTNAYGCSVSLPVLVLVNCDSVFIPSGFSPNADGTNDGFVIEGIENYPDNKLWVYNRWGGLVYKTRGYENKWDGISNISGAGQGSKVPSGTYFYILDLGDGSSPRNGYLVLKH